MQKGDEMARIYPDKGSYDNKIYEYVAVNATIVGIIGCCPVELYFQEKAFQDSGYQSAARRGAFKLFYDL